MKKQQDLFDFAYLTSNFQSHIDTLYSLARHERWDYLRDPQPNKHQVLWNYIRYTFKRLSYLHEKNPQEKYLYFSTRAFCFNTGLFTDRFESIYALFAPNDSGYTTQWKLQGFYKESAHELNKIHPLPQRANYFDSVRDLIYDTRRDLRINIDHILGDEENLKRVPEQYRDMSSLPIKIRAHAVEYAKIRIQENYKAAVPQYFNGKIQFLIPISLEDPTVVDLSLAVRRDGDVYTGKTCLTLDMAYNNARLIAKPESDWLIGGI